MLDSPHSIVIKERVLVYRPAQLEKWKGGDKSLLDGIGRVNEIEKNQPSWFFGEALALRWYHDNEGWRGYYHYGLGFESTKPKRDKEGLAKLRETIPPDRLESLLKLRREVAPDWGVGGRPDLFLFKSDGSFKFAEVKKAGDKLKPRQFKFIAQILSALGCEVDVVFVRADSAVHEPRSYSFDLIRHEGSQCSVS